MKVFVLLLVFTSVLTVIDCAPVASPEPCFEIIFRVLQLFLTTTSRPRRREFTTPEEDEPEPETTPGESTDVQPTADSSGESADGPVDATDIPDADMPSTSETNSDETPNEIIPKDEDTIRRLRKANNRRKDWWKFGMKF